MSLTVLGPILGAGGYNFWCSGRQRRRTNRSWSSINLGREEILRGKDVISLERVEQGIIKIIIWNNKTGLKSKCANICFAIKLYQIPFPCLLCIRSFRGRHAHKRDLWSDI